MIKTKTQSFKLFKFLQGTLLFQSTKNSEKESKIIKKNFFESIYISLIFNIDWNNYSPVFCLHIKHEIVALFAAGIQVTKTEQVSF